MMLQPNRIESIKTNYIEGEDRDDHKESLDIAIN